MDSLTKGVRDIIKKELESNSQLILQDIYRIVIKEYPEIDQTKKKHRVRSVIDSLLKKKRIERTAGSTYKRILD